jgi:hypothetical protein
MSDADPGERLICAEKVIPKFFHIETTRFFFGTIP